MKKTAIIFHYTDIYSGGNRSLLDLLREWVKDPELKITAVIPKRDPELIRTLSELGVPWICAHYYWATYFRSEKGLRRVLHIPVKRAEQMVNYITASRLSGKLKREGFSVIYTNTSVITLGALIRKKNPDIRHIWHFREFGEEDQGLAWFPDREKFYELVNSGTDDVVYLSKALERKFRDVIVGSASHVIYDDVSFSYYQERHAWYRPGDPVRILMAGQLKEGKGQMEVLEAMLLLDQEGIPVQLGIAGEGNEPVYRRQLEDFVRQNHMESYIRMLGQVRDMNSLRSGYDFGVVASRSEAFGRVTVEGMLSGLLMIGADAAGTSELIRNGVTGFLYPAGNPEALAGILKDIYDGQIDVKGIARAGQESALRFTRGNCAKTIAELFKGSCDA